MCLWAGIQDPHPEQANRAPNWEHPRPQEPFFIDVVTGTKRAGGASLYRGMEEGPFSSLCFLVLLRARQRQRTSQAVATRSPGRCRGLRAASTVISLGFQSAFRDTPRPVDITQHNHPKYPQSYSQSPRSACGVTGSLGTDQTWLPQGAGGGVERSAVTRLGRTPPRSTVRRDRSGGLEVTAGRWGGRGAPRRPPHTLAALPAYSLPPTFSPRPPPLPRPPPPHSWNCVEKFSAKPPTSPLLFPLPTPF